MSKVKIIDLGMHPFSDTFISKEQLSLSEPIYPLNCYLDPVSSLITTGVKTSADDRYNLYDYSYTSSNSNFSRSHWNDYSEFLAIKGLIEETSSVIEIGSNDGYLSLQIKEKVKNIIGIDSSRYISDLAIKNGLYTIPEIFNSEQAIKIKNKHGRFNLIIANNVLNHIDDLHDFCRAIDDLLDDKGRFIFEVPYWKYTVKDFKYDQIYHEHVNYFTLKSIDFIFNKFNLFIEDFLEVDYHGGSLRVVISRSKKECYNLKQAIISEEKLGLFSISTYIDFQEKIEKDRSELIIKLHQIKSEKIPIIAVGAAAKGNTFLNFHKLDSSIIDFVTDSSPHKIGKFTPLSRIEISSDEEVFKNYQEAYALILSWNLSKPIKKKLKELNPKIKFLN